MKRSPMTHRRSIRQFIIALLLGLMLTISAFAGSKGKSHRSAKDGRSKTQHVSGYTTKKGKHVKPYKRRPAQ